jgi:hypothetical protein
MRHGDQQSHFPIRDISQKHHDQYKVNEDMKINVPGPYLIGFFVYDPFGRLKEEVAQ